jgi:hypothetical protein
LQTLPQLPQLFGSLDVFTQALGVPHATSSAGHTIPQLPPVQLAMPPIGAAHTFPHLPQLFVSVFVLTSQPFVAFVSQSA